MHDASLCPGSDGTLAGHLQATVRYVPGSLAGASAWQTWSGVTLPLPPCLGQLAWECRLVEGEHAVDLQVGIGEDPDTRAGLRELGAPPPGWETAFFLLSTWAAGLWGGLVSGMFLEVDMPRGTGAVRPLLFPRLEAPDRQAWADTAKSVLALLSDGAAAPAQLERLGALVAALPDGADPRYVSWLGARGRPVGRWIGAVPCIELAGFLVRIGWPGDAARVAADIEHLNPWSAQVSVGLDFTDVVGPFLGVELYWPGAGAGDPRLTRALDLLATWPELSAPRLDAARAWARGDGVPAALRPELQVKVGYNQGRRSAKAYLGAWTSPPVGS